MALADAMSPRGRGSIAVETRIATRAAKIAGIRRTGIGEARGASRSAAAMAAVAATGVMMVVTMMGRDQMRPTLPRPGRASLPLEGDAGTVAATIGTADVGLRTCNSLAH